MAAAANVNLFNNANHNLDAKAFVARTMPEAAQFPNFNTYGAGAEYMYKWVLLFIMQLELIYWQGDMVWS